MVEQHLYRSVQLKKSEVTGLITKILKALSQNVPIQDPDVFIMMRVENDISDVVFTNNQEPKVKIINSIQFEVSSSKGIPPGAGSL